MQMCSCSLRGGSRRPRLCGLSALFFLLPHPLPCDTDGGSGNSHAFHVIELLPAILTSSATDFSAKCAVAATCAGMIHVDVTDASVVPRPSLTVEQIQALDIPLPIELHLMVADADVAIRSVTSPRVTRILFHPHAVKNPAATLLSVREEDREAGIVLDAMHREYDIAPLINLCNQLTVLTVPPGYQGSQLDASMLELARFYHEKYPHCSIEVDGGIKLENAPQVASTHATRYVVGSGLWSSKDPKAMYEALSQGLST